MKLTVILPCLNAGETIATQLAALADQHSLYPWEVIVSDNGSTDKSVEIVKRYRDRFPELSVVDSSDRKGAAHARNIGAHAATGDRLIFCDADDEVAPGWLAAMASALSEHDFVACRIDVKRLTTPRVQEVFRHNAQQFGLQEFPIPPYLPHAGGGTIGLKKSVHEAVGGFDESLTALEDTDYCFRIQLAGIKLHFVPDAIVHIRLEDNIEELYNRARLWASYTLLMYKRYHRLSVGRISRPWLRYLKTWRSLLRGLPTIRSRSGLALWVWYFGWQIGTLQGSLRYRVPPVTG